jgi:hypothetical protein
MVRGMEIKALCSIYLFVSYEDTKLMQESSTVAGNYVCVSRGQLQFFVIH